MTLPWICDKGIVNYTTQKLFWSDKQLQYEMEKNQCKKKGKGWHKIDKTLEELMEEIKGFCGGFFLNAVLLWY